MMTHLSKRDLTSFLSSMKTLGKASVGISIITATALTLSGCATTQSLTPQQCQTSNWQEVGYADGLRGRSGAYFGQYANQCASLIN